jgi:poly-gamma-glutamate capsule biosynthesis protein CapA/YwtB (metallophosphatase superfamily)
MHAGAEGATADQVTGKTEYYDGEDRGNPEVFAHDAINDGASAVIASGPHVLRGMEFYKGHLIDYSLGNFAGYNNFSTTNPLDLSGILRFKLTGSGRFVSATWVSLLLNTQGQPDVDTTGQAAVFVNQLSTHDFGANAAKIEANGSIVPAG